MATDNINDNLDDEDLALLRAAGLTPMRSCLDCVRGWRGNDSRVHCGASPDVDPAPPWAQRKYSTPGILAAIFAQRAGIQVLKGLDCEHIDPRDAEFCGQYEQKS